jgi:hypothetical protein
MPKSPRLPARFPVGTKYVLESRGQFIRRSIEFPNGNRVQLRTRRALSCASLTTQQNGVVPDQIAGMVDAPSLCSPVGA